MKKLLISLAAGLVLDVLIVYVNKQYQLPDHTQDHYDRWRTILGFLQEMKSKGLPL